NGRIYVSSVSAIPLESNFTQHALFPVSLVRAAELSGYTTPLYATLADNSFISLSRVTPSANGLYTLKNMQSNQEFIAQSRNNGTTIELFIPNEISTAGYYEIASDSSIIGGIALNYTRSESPVNFYSSDELKLKMTNVPFSVEDATPEMLNNLATKLAGGKTYWWTLILIALFLLALEILVIQLWKTKS
ncbi:MAG: hypothetical protein ACKO8Q_03775, partial [Bacteroidota bacterium]